MHTETQRLVERFAIKVTEPMRQLLHWLEQQPSDAAKALCGKKSAAGITDEDMHGLGIELLRDARNKQIAHGMLHALMVWIDQGNHHELWSLCPPGIPIWIPSPVSPYDADARGYPARYREIKEALDKLIRGDRSSWSPKIEIGAIFLSAIMEGGLHGWTLISAFAAHAHEPLNVHQGWSWLELRLHWRKQINAEFRRWFPDPVSECLLLGMSQASKKFLQEQSSRRWSQKGIWLYIKSALRHVKLPSQHIPDNLAELLSLCTYQQGLSGPMYLRGYKNKSMVSHSLRTHAWLRLLGVHVTTIDELPVIEGAEQLEKDRPLEEQLIESPWYTNLMRVIRSDQGANINQQLQNLSTELSDQSLVMPRLLVDWVDFMLEKGSSSGHKLARSTITHYMSLVGKRLVGQVGNEEIRNLSAEGFTSLYQGVLDDAVSKGHRRNIGRSLREFHHFLVMRHDAALIDESEVLGIGVGLSAVDANVLTIEEYERILLELRRYPPLLGLHVDLAEVAALIVMIAFRCGTRRMEVLRLRISDLHVTNDRLELLIRPWENRRLKTKSSTRKIPMQHFLNTDEQVQLRAWWQRRSEQERLHPFSPQLFAIPEAGMDGVTQELLYPKLHAVMRAVTGDPTIRFHHLRHSFGSWLTLRLYLGQLQHIPKLFAHLPRTQAWLQDSGGFRQGLYQHGQMTRKDLHAVASLLGHAGPEMSIEHYVHFLDLIAMLDHKYDVQNCQGLALPISLVPVPIRTIYNKAAQKNVQAQLMLARKYHPERTTLYPIGAGTVGGGLDDVHQVAPEQTAALDIFKNLWGFLVVSGKHPEYEFRDLCERFGLSELTGERYQQRAQSMANLHSGKQGGFRHRVMTWQVEGTNTEIRGQVPEWPRNKRDIAMIERLAEPMYQLALHPDTTLADGVTVTGLLKHYVEKSWSTRHEILFMDYEHPMTAIGYLAMLERLGLEKTEISLSFFSEASRQAWHKQLVGYEQLDSVLSTAPNKNSRMLGKAIGIKVIDDGLYTERAGSQGFQLLMYLASVMMRT